MVGNRLKEMSPLFIGIFTGVFFNSVVTILPHYSIYSNGSAGKIFYILDAALSLQISWSLKSIVGAAVNNPRMSKSLISIKSDETL